MRSGSARERVLRTIALLFAVGALVFGALDAPALVAQWAWTPTWWTVTAMVLSLGAPLALGAAAPAAPVRALPVLAGCTAVGYLVVLVTLPLVGMPLGTHTDGPWALQLTAVGTTAAAIAFPRRLAAATVLAVGALVVVDRLLTAGVDLALIAAQDGAYAALFCAVFAALAIGSLSAAARTDRAADDADAALLEAHAERAREDERTRVGALVHDEVLTVLLAAGSTSAPAALDADAARALERLRAADPSDGSERIEDLVRRLREAVDRSAPRADLAVQGATDAVLPSAAADAVVDSAAEALRNAARHAGDRAEVAVRVQVRGDGVEVTVVDDGPGFDPSRVAASRRGIAGSIVGRMRSAGGLAEVRSRPGRGTAVRLRWPAP